MGKRIIAQRRGRGTPTYKAKSHNYVGMIKHRKYDEIEKTNVIYGKVKDILHCPGHSAPLALVEYENKEKTLMASPDMLYCGKMIASGLSAPIDIGNTLPLKNIPIGTQIYNIESKPGDGGKFVRASGNSARVIAKMENKVVVLMPSKKQKDFNPECRATIGVIAGVGRKEKPVVKAGKRYHAMRAKNKLYPRTSGVAMNAVDHPFGSGRGRHVGKPKTPSRFAPPGRKVGLLRAKRTGKKK